MASVLESAPIVLTGLGVVSAAGRGLDATEATLRAGRSCLGPLTRFPSPRNGHHRVGEVAQEWIADPAEPRTRALARLALADALDDARLEARTRRIALVLGTCTGGMPETEEAIESQLAGRGFPERVWSEHPCGATTHALAEDFGLRGPRFTISTACSSGAQALVIGRDVLLAGLADAVVAGGADALCRLTLNGFASLFATDPKGCRPFDVERDGMSLGEGAAFCVLEREDVALERGARIHVELAGAGNTCDAFHPTAPEPDGRGAEAAMRAALRDAGSTVDAVDYVNAHGTGTPGNDQAEGRALARLFGTRIPPVSSVKAIFGHTLGAAGAIEAIVCSLGLARGFLPGTSGLTRFDPDCEVEPLTETVTASPRFVLSNSFGFGGNNTVLALRRRDA